MLSLAILGGALIREHRWVVLVAVPAKAMVNEDGKTFVNMLVPDETDDFPKDIICWDCNERFGEVFGTYCSTLDEQEGFDGNEWERIL